MLTTEFSGNNFTIKNRNRRVCIEGMIDQNILDRITDATPLLEKIDAFLERFTLSPPTSNQELRDVLGDDLPNFLFISSLLDYGNIGTSETLSLHLMELYHHYPFLFRPNDSFWHQLNEMPAARAKKIVESILIPLSGLFRTDFRGVVVPNWTEMIAFLRDRCANNARNFFSHITRSLLIGADNPAALSIFVERLHKTGSRAQLKQQLGINFAIGPKTGLLLLSVMTENRRGFGVLDGVTPEQVRMLHAPIDSAVIRVMFNTGLVKVTQVNAENAEGKFTRSEMTDVCQRAMDLLSAQLGVLPIELDHFIWSVGTIPCKHRGASCFICPITELCDSWNHGYVKESSGAEYRNRCFSFARPQTGKNALYLRGCTTCSQNTKCNLINGSTITRHPNFGPAYVSQRFTPTEEKLTATEIEQIVED